MRDMANSIFISHSSSDSQWCHRLSAALAAVGYDVWYDDQGLRGAAPFVQTLEREITTRDVFILILTPDSMASEWVRREIDLAIASHRKIVPIQLQLVSIADSGFLRTIQWINATDQDLSVVVRQTVVAIESQPVSLASLQSDESLNELLLRAKALVHDRRLADALDVCNRALSLFPQSADAWVIKSEVFFALSDYEKGVESLRSAISVAPTRIYEDSHVLDRLVSALRILHRGEEAISACNEALKHCGAKQRYTILKQKELMLLVEYGFSRPEDLIAVSDEILALNPRDGVTFARKVCLLHDIGKSNLAMTEFDRRRSSVNLSDASWEAHLGTTLLQCERYADARQYFRAALAHDWRQVSPAAKNEAEEGLRRLGNLG